MNVRCFGCFFSLCNSSKLCNISYGVLKKMAIGVHKIAGKKLRVAIVLKFYLMFNSIVSSNLIVQEYLLEANL